MTKNAARGIPTRYREVRFRSRLEARWAAFFDRIGWVWLYEPEDADHWIPDFLIRGVIPFYVEVGPCELWSEYHAKAEKALAAFPPPIGEQGDDRFAPAIDVVKPTLVLGKYPVVDIVGRYPMLGAGLLTTDGRYAGTGAGAWVRCDVCGDPAVLHIDGIYRLVPCGHWTDSATPADEPSVVRLWNAASTPTQWLAPRTAA